MSDVTRILNEIDDGDPQAAEKLLPLVYQELRKLAAAKMSHESPDHTLQATALVHEAFLRLTAGECRETGSQQWDNRRHFLSAAAEAMRRILVENARRKGRKKRGGGRRRVDLDEVALPVADPIEDVAALSDALEKLADRHPDKAELVKLRFFAGLTIEEAAAALRISTATAERHWTFARAWLFREITADASGG